VEHGGAYDTQGRHATVLDWLASFPTRHVTSRPALCVVAAVTALGVGDGECCARWMRFLEQAVSRAVPRPTSDPETLLKAKLLRVATARAPIADLIDDAELAYRELPPGNWHAMACLVFGALLHMHGEADRAVLLFAEGAAEAKIIGAPTLRAYCLAELALIHDDADDHERATTEAHSARAALDAHGPEKIHTTALVAAMNALVGARAGDVNGARADLLLARRLLAGLESVMPWLNVQTRVVLVRTTLLLGDRGTARTLLHEADQQLCGQPDSIWAKQQLAELSEAVDAARQLVPRGSPMLTTAELKVLHYLPTNLRISDIAARLYVSRNTAKSHAAAIYRKLGTSSRAEAVALARQAGLLPDIGSADH
jgi:LuxR family transcriptional regulator, maltose regulon positive regulatory protein